MKKVIALSIIFASVVANASTMSEKRATEMVAVLSSPEVQSLLQQEDGVGNIEGIFIAPSITEASSYAIQFSSYSGPQVQTCIVPVSILNSSITLGDARCKAKAAMPPVSKVCANPSPIGCRDDKNTNQPR